MKINFAFLAFLIADCSQLVARAVDDDRHSPRGPNSEDLARGGNGNSFGGVTWSDGNGGGGFSGGDDGGDEGGQRNELSGRVITSRKSRTKLNKAGKSKGQKLNKAGKSKDQKQYRHRLMQSAEHLTPSPTGTPTYRVRAGKSGSFSLPASGTDTPTPSPTEPSSKSAAPSDAMSRSFIYALSNDYRNFCGYDVHWAPKCNGRLASITNSDELDLAKMLFARNPGVKVGGVSGSAWIGGMYDSQNSQWGWSDGTTWFDDDEKMWNASPVPTGPRILLKTDGTNYWYKPITSGYCGPSKKGAAIVILPADYDDPNAAFYQNHDFALCRDFMDTIIDTVAIV